MLHRYYTSILLFLRNFFLDASLFTTTGIKGGERHVQQNKNEVNFDAIRPFHNFPGFGAYGCWPLLCIEWLSGWFPHSDFDCDCLYQASKGPSEGMLMGNNKSLTNQVGGGGDGNKDFEPTIGSDDGDKENEPQQENVTYPIRRFACDFPCAFSTDKKTNLTRHQMPGPRSRCYHNLPISCELCGNYQWQRMVAGDYGFIEMGA